LRQLGRPLQRLQPPSRLPEETKAFLERHGIELTIPLIVGTELVGLYNLGPKSSGDAYNREEIRLLYVTGQQAAVAVQNSRLFQAEREQRQMAQALEEAATVVSSNLNLDQVLDRILEQVERVIAGDASNIMLIEENHARVVRWRGYEQLGAEDQIAFLRVSLSRFPSLAEVIRTGKPIVIADTAADPTWVLPQDWAWLRSFVSAPIRVADRTVGFLNLDGTRPNQFGLVDARRLEAFSHHAATAIENARLYEQARQEVLERQRAQERIKTSLEEKEVLLKEIHHRVKNNLQVISSLLYLQSKSIEDERTVEILKESQNRVRSMALIHQRLYQSRDLSKIDFAEYVRSLAAHLFRSYGVDSGLIRLNIDITRVFLGIDTAVPCGLILNELISNSLKYAFPQGRSGEISVEFRQGSLGQCTLMVRDNGVGLAEELDLQNAESLGLQLVNSLVDQLEGTIELDRDGGTAFRIVFIEQKY
jgi:two-component sensor histidine kinase